jgi:hypothetical protein
MKQEETIKEIHKGVKKMCPLCKNEYRLKDEKKKIVLYSACSMCLLQKQLGHSYTPQTWDCECGKKFMTKKNLDRHSTKFSHNQCYKQIEI